MIAIFVASFRIVLLAHRPETMAVTIRPGPAILSILIGVFLYVISHYPTVTPLFTPHGTSSFHTNLPHSSSFTQSCEVCVSTPADALCLKYGIDSVRISRAYEGSGFRMRRFLAKALRGEEVVIGVIGASVSAGHGLRGKMESAWQNVVFKDFLERFPSAKIVDASSAGMDSETFRLPLPRQIKANIESDFCVYRQILCRMLVCTASANFRSSHD